MYELKFFKNNIKILINGENCKFFLKQAKIVNIDFSDNQKKYLYLQADVTNQIIHDTYHELFNIEERLEKLNGENYIKSCINGDVLKLRLPYRYSKFEVDTDAIISMLEKDDILTDIQIELNNVYKIQKTSRKNNNYNIMGLVLNLKKFSQL